MGCAPPGTELGLAFDLEEELAQIKGENDAANSIVRILPPTPPRLEEAR